MVTSGNGVSAAVNPDLSVVVTAFEAEARVRRLLPMLERAVAQLGVESELILVDNGSTDGTASAAAAAAPSARVVTIKPNHGAAGGRNAGARAARGRWLLCCDDDVEVAAEALGALWAARRARTCTVPLVRDLRGVLQNATVARWGWGDLKLYEESRPLDRVAYPLGACLLVERQLYWEAGGFDERFQPNGYEDAALGYALRALGAETIMVPGAGVTHHVHGDEVVDGRLRSVAAHRQEYQERIYRTRWLFDLLVLRGWRRWMVVSLGLPRVLAQSWRLRSWAPARGYGQAWRAFLGDLTLPGRRHRRTRY